MPAAATGAGRDVVCMPLIVLAASIVLLLVLIARLKVNAFLALLLTAFMVGVANGMPPAAALQSILKGIGDTMGSLVLILVFGAILGKLIEESGAAHTISYALTNLLGQRRIQLSVLATGFIVGLPMIYNASFLVLIPLIYTLSTTTRLPLMYLGIPLSAALSVTHGYLPPHPAPTSIAAMYHADVNLTLLYGLALAVPATLLAGPVLARFFRHVKNMPPPVAVSQSTPASAPGKAANLETYTSASEKLSFQYPNDWTFTKIDCVNSATQKPAECAQLQSPDDKSGTPIIINFQYNDSGREYIGASAAEVQTLSVPNSKKPLYLVSINETNFGTGVLGLYDKSVAVGDAVSNLVITSEANSPLLVSMIAYLQKGAQSPSAYTLAEFKSHPYYNEAVAIFKSLSY